MKTTIAYTVRFSASHQTAETISALCGPRLHGHDWYLTAVFSRSRAHSSTLTAEHAIDALADELNLRDVNDMVAIPPTPEGIAGWAIERLRMDIPGLISVSVGYSQYSATVEV